MIRDLLNDSLRGEWSAVFVLACLAFCVAAVMWLIYAVADEAGTAEAGEAEGAVVSVEHHGAWMQMVQSGKVLVPIHHPERWTITVSGEGMVLSGDFDAPNFNEGQRVRFTYGKGRPSGSPHLKKIL